MTAAMRINTTAGMNDLIALAREIEAVEQLPRRLALRLAISRIEEYWVDADADVRYVPAGMKEDPWTSVAIGPLLWDGASPLLAVGVEEILA